VPGLTVKVFSKRYELLGFCNDYKSCKVEFVPIGVGAGSLVIDGAHPLAAAITAADETTIPVTVATENRRWSGRVATFDEAGPSGSTTVTATLESDYAYLHGILGWPNTLLPIGAQTPSHDVQVGPCETIVKHYIRENAARMGLPLVVLPAPSSDPSAWMSLSARMTPDDELIKDVLKRANLGLSVAIWLPNDPQPAGLSLTTPTLVVNTITGADKGYVAWDDRLGHISTATTSGKTARSTTAISGGKQNGFLDAAVPAMWKDVFLAFDSYTDMPLLDAMGPFAYKEAFTSVGSGAFTADARLASLAQIAKDRGSRAVTITVADGAPWKFGIDYNEQDVVGAHVNGRDYRQTVTAVTVADDDKGLAITPTIGDTTGHDDPIVAAFNQIKELFANLAQWTLGS